jgi:hypothetical protein
LLILVKTRITIGAQSHELPWGTSSFRVDPGAHNLRVSHNWIWRGGAGGAETMVAVEAGETVRVRYRPPWLVFLSGKLTVEAKTHGRQQIEPLVFRQDPHTRGPWKIAVLAVGLASTLIAAGIGARIGQWVSGDESGSDGWRTTGARGMSISLPHRFHVVTDPADYAEGMAEVGLSDTDELAELIEQFPDVFALAAYEPRPDDEAYARASVVVLRMPSTDERLDESAEFFTEGAEEGGFFDITAQNEMAVGTGRYAAVRIDGKGNLPGYPRERSVSYIIDGGSQLWVVTFAALSDEYETLSPTFDRSMASLKLPTANGDDG